MSRPYAWTAAPGGSKLALIWARANGGPAAPSPDDVRTAIDEYEGLDPICGEGPAHVVLGDGNLDVDSLAACIRACLDDYAQTGDAYCLQAAHFMACLLQLSDDERGE